MNFSTMLAKITASLSLKIDSSQAMLCILRFISDQGPESLRTFNFFLETLFVNRGKAALFIVLAELGRGLAGRVR